MQLDILFEKEKIRLPICTSATIQGLIYNALKEDIKYSSYVHNFGKTADGRRFKLFTFSELQGKYIVENKDIIFLNEAKLSIRSADAYLIQLLFSYFSKEKNVTLAGDSLKIADLHLTDNCIYDSEIIVRTISPITVYVTTETGYTEYFSPQDERFYMSIVSNARRKWVSYYGDDSEFELEIILMNENSFFKRATRFKDTFITAWHGKFILKAPPKVLNFLYQTGLGSKNSQGFGMFEIINS